MIRHIAPAVTALQAQAAANFFLNENLPDRFSADQPQLSGLGEAWTVPVILSYPFIGSIGPVGEILVGLDSEKIISHTPLAEMKQRAVELYALHQDDIEAAFS